MSVQGISFYDFLGKFIPGALLLLLFDSNLLKVKLDSPEILFWIAAAYLIGIIWDLVLRYFFKKLRCNQCMLIRSYKKMVKRIKYNSEYKAIYLGTTATERNIKYYYDKAYSLLMINNMLGTLPKQESHENFLRNIWLIIIGYLLKALCSPCCNAYCNCACGKMSHFITIGLVAFILIIPFLWYNVQMSVYCTVWDNAYWTQYHISKKEENK